MAVISTIRDQLKTRLATISGLRAYDVWPDKVNLDAAIVMAASGQYHQTIGSGSMTLMQFDVLVVVSLRAGLARAQEALDAYLASTGSQSILVALENGALSGSEIVTVLGYRDYGEYEIDGVEFFGAILEVRVKG